MLVKEIWSKPQRMERKKENQQAGEKPQLYHRYWIWAVLVVIILAAAAIRIRMLEVPLERDEGEYAYAGQLILQGIAPYDQVYNMKLPGIYAAYVVILAIFGQTCSGIHMGLLVVNAVTILLLFLLTKKLFGPFVGLSTAAVFALLSINEIAFGFTANAEHFVLVFVFGGILILVYTVNNERLWPILISGLLFGTGFLMKQHGAAFIIFGGLYLFFCELRRRPFKWRLFAGRGTLFLTGVVLPFAVTCLIFWRLGVFGKFWFWTFDYAWEYATTRPLAKGLNNLKVISTMVVGSAISIWILACLGLVLIWWNKRIRRHGFFVVGFLLFSFLALCPGLYFRRHYFLFLMPAIAMLTSIGANSIQSFFVKSRMPMAGKVVPVLIVLGVLFCSCYQQRKYLFYMSPTEISRTIYYPNPFAESLEIARFIKEHSAEDESIAVIGSEPQIYFYSNRRSATGYIYTYELMKRHSYTSKMQEEMIQQIESNHPKFLVFVNVPLSWLMREESETTILRWFGWYQKKYYNKIGLIDLFHPQDSVYCWGQTCKWYKTRSKYWIAVYQRKNLSP